MNIHVVFLEVKYNVKWSIAIIFIKFRCYVIFFSVILKEFLTFLMAMCILMRILIY